MYEVYYSIQFLNKLKKSFHFNSSHIQIDNKLIKEIAVAILGRLDDPCANVRELAVECLPKIGVDPSDDTFNESSDSHLAETIILRLVLYLDDPYIKIRPILLGKHPFMPF